MIGLACYVIDMGKIHGCLCARGGLEYQRRFVLLTRSHLHTHISTLVYIIGCNCDIFLLHYYIYSLAALL